MTVFWSLLASSCLLLWYIADGRLHPQRRARLLVYAAAAIGFMFLAFATHAAPYDWKADAARCEHAAETNPAVCPGCRNGPGWPWLARCVAQLRGGTSDQQTRRLDWCIQTTAQRRSRPASQAGTTLYEALQCAGLDR